MALKTLAIVLVFLTALAFPLIEEGLAWEPGISETDTVDLMNLAYQEGYEHGMSLCQPKLPKGPKVNRRGKPEWL